MYLITSCFSIFRPTTNFPSDPLIYRYNNRMHELPMEICSQCLKMTLCFETDVSFVATFVEFWDIFLLGLHNNHKS